MAKVKNTIERFDDVDGVSRFNQCSCSISDEFGNPQFTILRTNKTNMTRKLKKYRVKVKL